ncbi:MAG: hypothetical protein U0575_08645 [Phycisphaerales bacterium]
MRSRFDSSVLVLVPLLLAAAASEVRAAEFATGDLYLVSANLPNPNPPGFQSGVLRITPGAATQTLLVQFPVAFGSHAATYDPFRKRIVAKLGGMSVDLRLIDANGAIATLPTSFDQSPRDLAPTGDGRIYLLGSTKIGWIDGAGQTHDLLDVNGVNVFAITLGGQSGTMIYDASSNALVVADSLDPETRVRRIPLSVDGTRVAGAIVQTTVVGSNDGSEEPVGLSARSVGDLLLTIDDNSNSTQPRMQLVAPATLATTPFAFSGYQGVGGETAGCYSNVTNAAIMLDTLNDVLRAYAQGQSGGGSAFAGGVSSPSGSGDMARLIEIGGTIGGGGVAPLVGDLNGDGHVDGGDLGLLLSNWGPCPNCASCVGDINGDCIVDGADLGTLLGAWTG